MNYYHAITDGDESILESNNLLSSIYHDGAFMCANEIFDDLSDNEHVISKLTESFTVKENDLLDENCDWFNTPHFEFTIDTNNVYGRVLEPIILSFIINDFLTNSDLGYLIELNEDKAKQLLNQYLELNFSSQEDVKDFVISVVNDFLDECNPEFECM